MNEKMAVPSGSANKIPVAFSGRIMYNSVVAGIF